MEMLIVAFVAMLSEPCFAKQLLAVKYNRLYCYCQKNNPGPNQSVSFKMSTMLFKKYVFS